MALLWELLPLEVAPITPTQIVDGLARTSAYLEMGYADVTYEIHLGDTREAKRLVDQLSRQTRAYLDNLRLAIEQTKNWSD